MQLFKNGVKRAKIAKDLDIPSSTVYDVCKNVDRMIAEYKQCGNGGLLHSKPHSFDIVDQPLLEFFHLARDSKLPISGALLLKKARIYATDLGYADPEKLDINWVNHWKKWNEIVVKKLHGKAESVDQDTANDWWKNRLPQLLKEFTAENIFFNCDETGLFYCCLPDHTHAFKTEKCAGGKKSRERLTVLITASMTGKKLPLLVIGKAKNQHCLK